MKRDMAERLLPRFLNAVTGMAVSRGAVHARVADVVDQIIVFLPTEFPVELKPHYAELRSLLSEPSVPEGALRHPELRRQIPAYYLSPRRARRAADLVIEIFEAVVWSLTNEPPSDAHEGR